MAWSALAKRIISGTVEAIIHDFAAPLLLGQSAFDRERHWQNLFCYANFFGYAGAKMRAISAIDIALWDLLGQYTRQPIYNLLGGRCRESIRIYNTCVNTPAYADQNGFCNSPGELAKSLLAEGVAGIESLALGPLRTAMQVSSVTGPAGWSAVGPVGHTISAASFSSRGCGPCRRLARPSATKWISPSKGIHGGT